MGAVDDFLAAMSEPDRACLRRVVAIARGIAPDHPIPDGVVEEMVRLRRAEIRK